jgi:hypothetical protein
MPEGNGAFTGDVQTIWDSTCISLAETCARKYYYTMIAQITGKDPSVHLRFGGLYATALETYYKVRAKEKLSHDEAVLLAVKDAMHATWDREKGQPEIFLDNKKTRMNLIRTIVWYLDEYGEETESSAFRTHYKSDGMPAVELSFKFQISPDLTLSGHLDRVVSYAGEGLYVMDQKTTNTTLSPHFFNSFSPNTQMSLYTWAGQIILNSPVRGVVIDAAQIAVGLPPGLHLPDRGATGRVAFFRSSHHPHDSGLFKFGIRRKSVPDEPRKLRQLWGLRLPLPLFHHPALSRADDPRHLHQENLGPEQGEMRCSSN